MPRVITETFEDHRIVRGPDGKGGYLLKLERLNGFNATGDPIWMPIGEFNADLKKSGKAGGDYGARMCRWVSSMVPIEAKDNEDWPVRP